MMRGTSPIYLATKKVAKTCLDNKIIFFYKNSREIKKRKRVKKICKEKEMLKNNPIKKVGYIKKTLPI